MGLSLAQEVRVGPSGGVVLGEQGHASFAILNEGALEVQYNISAHDSQVRPIHVVADRSAQSTLKSILHEAAMSSQYYT